MTKIYRDSVRYNDCNNLAKAFYLVSVYYKLSGHKINHVNMQSNEFWDELEKRCIVENPMIPLETKYLNGGIIDPFSKGDEDECKEKT